MATKNDKDLGTRLHEAYGASTAEQKSAFQRACSGDPEEITEEDLVLIGPLLDRMRRAADDKNKNRD